MAKVRSHKRDILLSFLVLTLLVTVGVVGGFGPPIFVGAVGWAAAWLGRDVLEYVEHRRKGHK